MRLGFNIPNLGPAAGPENIVKVAQRAESLGYDTVWVTERLLWPINPQTPYAGTPDGSLPEEYKLQLDPLDALTYAAAHTSRIGLGTSVLDMPYYNPVMLARSLTTLDVLAYVKEDDGRASVLAQWHHLLARHVCVHNDLV